MEDMHPIYLQQTIMHTGKLWVQFGGSKSADSFTAMAKPSKCLYASPQYSLLKRDVSNKKGADSPNWFGLSERWVKHYAHAHKGCSTYLDRKLGQVSWMSLVTLCGTAGSALSWCSPRSVGLSSTWSHPVVKLSVGAEVTLRRWRKVAKS